MRCYLTIVILALSSLAHAYPLAQPNAIELFKKSDIVCSGIITTTKEIGPAEQDLTGRTVRYLLATVLIRDLYKGELSGDQSIFIEFTAKTPVDSPSAGLAPDENALLFLKHKDGGTFVFADNQLGAMRFRSVPVEPGTDGLAKFEAAMASVLLSANQREVEYPALLLLTLDRLSPSTISTVSPAATSPDPEKASYVIAILIKWDTPQGLKQLEQFVALHGKDTNPPLGIGAVLGELSMIKNRQYLRTMEELSFSEMTLVRVGAMEAIRNMKMRDAAAVLVKHLSDSDSETRYLAVISLAETFDKSGEYGPGMDLFDKNPDYYVGLWKAWAQQTGITTAQ